MEFPETPLSDISWLVKGIKLEAKVWNIPTMIDAKCDTYEYHTNNESITTVPHGEEPSEGQTKHFQEGETPFGAITGIFAAIATSKQIGHLSFEVDSSLDKQFGAGFFKNMISESLKKANLNVGLLELNIYGWDHLDVTPFLELIQFQHLIITANDQPLLLNEKILRSGLLFLDVPIANVGELIKFEGIAVLLGKREKNNLSMDLVYEKIEKFKEGVPSKTEFFAVFDLKEWVTDEMVERLKSYCQQDDDDFQKPESKEQEVILRLDKEDQAAILIRGKQNVVFVRNGWRKWQSFLEALNLCF